MRAIHLVAVNTLAQLIGRAVSAATTLAITFLVAQRFGADGYGDFIKVSTYAAFFYLITDFGLNAIFLQHDERKMWPALLALRTAGGALLVLLAVALTAFLPGSPTQGYTPAVKLGILLFAPTILFQSFITTANAVFQKRLRYDLATWAIFFGSLVSLIALFMSNTWILVIGAVAAGSGVTALLSLFLSGKLTGSFRVSVSMEDLRTLFYPSIPLGVTLLFNLVYFRADSIILTLTRTTAEVGIYGLAYKVFEVILVFPTFFMNAVYPFMLARKNLQRILKKSFFFLLLLSVAGTVFIWVAAPLLVYIKQDFAQSVTALRILSVGLPFFFTTAVTMWALISLKKQTQLAVIYGISMIVNIVGNVLFIPHFGYIAAAWMTVVGEGIVLVLSGLVIVKYL